jgi:hypothetical protein
MPTKSGVATLADLKQGVSLFYVFSVSDASGTRRVAHEVERFEVIRVTRDFIGNRYSTRVHFKSPDRWSIDHPQGRPAPMDVDQMFAEDMGIHPKGRVWIRDVGHKCFLSYARAESYRKRLIATPQSAKETKHAIYVHQLLLKSMSTAQRFGAPKEQLFKMVEQMEG